MGAIYLRFGFLKLIQFILYELRNRISIHFTAGELQIFESIHFWSVNEGICLIFCFCKECNQLANWFDPWIQLILNRKSGSGFILQLVNRESKLSGFIWNCSSPPLSTGPSCKYWTAFWKVACIEMSFGTLEKIITWNQ